MKIGVDSRSLTDLWRFRGIARYVKNVIDYLIEEGHEVLLYSWPYNEADSSYDIEAFGSRNYLIWENISLVKRAKSDNIDVLLCPLNTSPLLYFDNCIVVVHDLIAFETKTLASIYKRLNLKFTVSRRRVISVSHTTLSLLPTYKLYPLDKFYVPNVIDMIENKDKLDKKNYFFTISGTSETKNIKNLLLGFNDYIKSGDKDLYILGDARSIGESIDKLNLRKLSSRIQIFNTGISEDHVSKLYRQCSAFVFVSTAEGFGIPLLEAMKYGCIIVRSDITVFNEIMESLGIIVDPFDYVSISNSLQRSDSESISTLLYHMILSKYHIESSHKQLEEIFKI